MKRYVEEGEVLPKGYGIAYYEGMNQRYVAYPVPINHLVRVARDLWYWLVKYRPSKIDKILAEEFNRGHSVGYSSALRDVKQRRQLAEKLDQYLLGIARLEGQSNDE